MLLLFVDCCLLSSITHYKVISAETSHSRLGLKLTKSVNLGIHNKTANLSLLKQLKT